VRLIAAAVFAASAVFAAAAVFAAMFLLTSCSPDERSPVTVAERTRAIVASVNALRWTDFAEHAHPGAEDYPTADAAFWEAAFTGRTLDESTIVISGNAATVEDGTDTFTFVLRDAGGGVYKAIEIQRSDGATVYH
jgi:hypothetical protein